MFNGLLSINYKHSIVNKHNVLNLFYHYNYYFKKRVLNKMFVIYIINKGNMRVVLLKLYLLRVGHTKLHGRSLSMCRSLV